MTEETEKSTMANADFVPELTDAEIAAIAAEVEDRLTRGDARLAVGQLVAERYYRNDLALYRSRGEKAAGLRRIAKLVRESGRVPLSLTGLRRMTAVAFQAAALGETATQLPFTAQAELLRVEDAGAKRELADAAVSEQLSVRDLRSRVDARLGVEQAGPLGPVASAVLAVERLRDKVLRLVSERGLDGEDDQRQRIVDALHAALTAVTGRDTRGVPTLAHLSGVRGIEEIATAAADAFLASGLTNADLVDLFNALQARVNQDPEVRATSRSAKRPRSRRRAEIKIPVEEISGPTTHAAAEPGDIPDMHSPPPVSPPEPPTSTEAYVVDDKATFGDQGNVEPTGAASTAIEVASVPPAPPVDEPKTERPTDAVQKRNVHEVKTEVQTASEDEVLRLAAHYLRKSGGPLPSHAIAAMWNKDRRPDESKASGEEIHRLIRRDIEALGERSLFINHLGSLAISLRSHAITAEVLSDS